MSDEIKNQNWHAIEQAILRDSVRTKYDKQNKMKIILEFLYTNFGIKAILEYDTNAILALFEYLDQKPMTRKAKSRYRYNLHSIIFNILKLKIRDPGIKNEIAFWNYVLGKDFYSFKQSKNSRGILYIEADEMTVFLRQLKTISIRDYIMFGILAYSGCRIGGLCALLIKNIDFQLGSFITQEKPTHDSSGENRYFLPRFFLENLRIHIIHFGLNPSERIVKITDKTVRAHLRKYRATWWPHLFRHTLRSLWAKKGIDPQIANLLLNHKPENIDAMYLQSLKNPKFLREQYDRYFPY